ncbi:MAG: hypothetical protein IKA65_07875 [Lentisphaeria bacterium]|nr:hypothetical protein [Lentisphaeria bacterium]
MLKTILAIAAAISVMNMAVAAEAKTAEAVKICEKTGKACTGGKHAAHNCKKGDKECSKEKVAVKHQCKKAAAKHQCEKTAAKAKICEKTGKACTGGKHAAHNCKKGATECSKEKAAPAKK